MSRVIVALDFDSAATALALVGRLDPELCKLKVGKELFTRAGPQLVEQLVKSGFDVFLDLKFHDIPNTVAGACRAAADLGVWMFNLHAQGGRVMLETARAAIDELPMPRRPLLIGVTVLTSIDQPMLREVGITQPLAQQVQQLARLSKDTGLDGVVCSALEAKTLRADLGKDFCLVTPGIRPSSARGDDQRRVMTPPTAIAAGSDYLVIGRPVTRAADPVMVLQEINQEIAGCLPPG
jgi:orotidine-5'-phosphate decarboxylase